MIFSGKATGKRRWEATPWSLPYGPAADAADIFYRFRLLLGRNPHREEWTGHTLRAGEPLDSVVASYLSSLEFTRRRLLAPEQMPEVELAQLPDFRIHVARDDAAVGRYVRADNYERDVTAIFRQLLQPGMGVLDIGANIGYFTMLSAALVGPAGFVLAIEPNPRNARLLEASRRANGFAHVTLSQTAAGSATGLLVLHTSHSNGTTSDPPEDAAALLAAETVPCVRADALLSPDQRIDLIKLDAEGAEYKALLGCTAILARDRPTIISEFSPDLMPGISGVSGPDYLQWIAAQDYRLAVIQPDGAAEEAVHWTAVMDAYARRGSDHLDLLATPQAGEQQREHGR